MKPKTQGRKSPTRTSSHWKRKQQMESYKTSVAHLSSKRKKRVPGKMYVPYLIVGLHLTSLPCISVLIHHTMLYRIKKPSDSPTVCQDTVLTGMKNHLQRSFPFSWVEIIVQTAGRKRTNFGDGILHKFEYLFDIIGLKE